MSAARFTSSAFDHDTTTTNIDAALAQLLRPLRFLRLDPIHWEANQTVQRTGASRHAEWRCGRSRWLAPVADLGVRNEQHDETSVVVAVLTHAILVFLKSAPATPEDSDRGASLVQYRPSETDEPFPGAVRAPNVAGVYRVYII